LAATASVRARIIDDAPADARLPCRDHGRYYD
jgi:hypothetical protein